MAFWALNLETLSEYHPIYAFDILGLARSSRPVFSNDPHKIEEVWMWIMWLNAGGVQNA